MKSHFINSKRRGFTLVELMVAMAITTIMVTILISITSMALDSWNRSRAEVRAARQAQAMTEIMARDFEAMVTRSGNSFEWFVANTQSDSVGPDSAPSPGSADLIFFTAATDRYDGNLAGDDAKGDISAVGYSLRYQDPIAGSTSHPNFVLYRKLVNPDETFNSLLGQEDLQAAFSPYLSDIENMANFVCENVYQFSVTVDLVNLSTQVGRRPATAYNNPVSVTLSQDVTRIRQFGNNFEANIPASALPQNVSVSPSTRIGAVEISITVLSDNAMNTIRSNPNLSTEAKENLISRNSFQYSKRVDIPGM